MVQLIDPLDEEPYDPLDEAAMQPDEDMVRGGPCDLEGFGGTVREARSRAGRLHAASFSKPLRPDVAISARRKHIFLRALAQTGIVAVAASAAGWSYTAARDCRRRDEGFAKSWDVAIEVAADLVEAALHQRAVHGIEKPIWHKPKDGVPEVIGYETVYSDPLMQTLIKGLKPEKYRDNYKVEHDLGSKGGVLVVPGVVPLDEWTLAAARQQAKYRETREDDQ